MDRTKTKNGAGGGGGGDQTNIDPVIRGLIAQLSNSGEVWPEIERKLWFGILEDSFKLIYKDASDKGQS